MEILQLRGRASETTLSHIHPYLFLYPFSSEYSFMTKYRKNSFLQFYIEIWHLLLRPLHEEASSSIFATDAVTDHRQS